MKMLDNLRSNNVNTKNRFIKALHSSILQMACFVAFAAVYSCSPSTAVNEQQISPEVAKKEQILRGQYLVNTSACHDCHTPKILTPLGPEIDTTRLLSGHPADEPVARVHCRSGPMGYLLLCEPNSRRCHRNRSLDL